MDDLFEQLKAAPPVNKNVNVLPKSKTGKKIMTPPLQDSNRTSSRRESVPSTSSSAKLQKLSKGHKSRSISPQISTPVNQIRPFKVLIGRKSLSNVNNTPVKDVKKDTITTAATVKPKDKNALYDEIRPAQSSQLPIVTANVTPTKAQKKQFIAAAKPSVLPKSRRNEKRNQKQTNTNKITTKRCLVRLLRQNLEKLQKERQRKNMNGKEIQNKEVPASPTKSRKIQKRKPLDSEKSLPSMPSHSSAAKNDRGSSSSISKRDRESNSPISKRGRLSNSPNSKRGRVSKSPISKSDRLSNSPITKRNRVSNSPISKSDRMSNSPIPKSDLLSNSVISGRGRGSKSPISKGDSLPNSSASKRRGSASSSPSLKTNKNLPNSPKRGRLSISPPKRSRLSNSPSKKTRLSNSPSKKTRLSNSPSKKTRSSNSPPSKRTHLSNSPTSKGRRSSTSPTKTQTGFYIKINTAPNLLRHNKSKEKKIDKSQTMHPNKLQNKGNTSASIEHNMKIAPTGRTKATKFTRTQLIKAFGKRTFQSHVRIERCRHPLMMAFDSNARARKIQAKSNKSKTLSVSFREQVEIFGSIDTDEESVDVEDVDVDVDVDLDVEYANKVCSLKKTSAPSASITNTAPAGTTEAITQSTPIVTPARLKKIENGKVIDDIEFDPAQFILPSSASDSVGITGNSSTPYSYSPGYKKREKKSFSPLKGDSISPRREQFKLANEKLPPSGLRRLHIDDIDEDDDDDCEYIVPTELPQHRTSCTISMNADESSGSFVSAIDDPSADSKNDSHATDEIFQSPSMKDEATAVVDMDKVCEAIVIEEQHNKKLDFDYSKEGGTATTTNTTNNSTTSEENASSMVNVSSMEDNSLNCMKISSLVLDEESAKDEDVIDRFINDRLDDITAKDFELPSLSVPDEEPIEEISAKDFELPPLVGVHDLELSPLCIQEIAAKVSEVELINNGSTTLAETSLN